MKINFCNFIVHLLCTVTWLQEPRWDFKQEFRLTKESGRLLRKVNLQDYSLLRACFSLSWWLSLHT